MTTQTNNQTVDNFLKTEVNRELLKYAVQRKISCRCGQILDVDKNSVYFEYTNTDGQTIPFVNCVSCFTKIITEINKEGYNDRIKDIIYCKGYKTQIKKLTEQKEINKAQDLDDLKYSIKWFGTNRSSVESIYTDGHILIDFSKFNTKRSFKSLMNRNLKSDNYFNFKKVSLEAIDQIVDTARSANDKVLTFDRLKKTEDRIEAHYTTDTGEIVRFNAHLLKIFSHYIGNGDFQLIAKDPISAVCVKYNGLVVGLIMPLRPL